MIKLKTGRLTGTHRKTIIENVKFDTQGAGQKKYDKAASILAKEIREDFLGADLNYVNEAPDRILGTHDGFYVYFGTGCAHLKLGEYMKCWNMGSGRPEYSDTHKFAKRFTKMSDKLAVVNDEWVNLRQNLRAMLDGCTSIKALLEQWPEGEKYLPEVEDKKKITTALAIPPSKINCLISHAKGENVDCEKKAA
ncbi:MAG: hypothetical protein HRT93_03400 [Piscirickettsiaceae bacterium]|nr:hypothetical protein [Piscirickettsiaceae bacterium]